MFAIFVFYAASMPGYKFSILPSGIVEFVMQRILLNSTFTLKMQLWSMYITGMMMEVKPKAKPRF
jgi:hypothetical protein